MAKNDDSGVDRLREAENTSGSSWSRGWSYLRRYYCGYYSSEPNAKNEDESSRESKADPLLNLGQEHSNASLSATSSRNTEKEKMREELLMLEDVQDIKLSAMTSIQDKARKALCCYNDLESNKYLVDRINRRIDILKEEVKQLHKKIDKTFDALPKELHEAFTKMIQFIIKDIKIIYDNTNFDYIKISSHRKKVN